jgi:inner membrane transporter RhtA
MSEVLRPVARQILPDALAGPALTIGSMLSVQLGACIAVPLMVEHGSIGVTAMRLSFAALVLAVVTRPNPGRLDRRQWIAVAGLGAAIAIMTLCLFEAVTLIPIGPAITIDFLGPLSVAFLSIKGWSRIALPSLAICGVLAICHVAAESSLNLEGVLLAALAAVGWAAYIAMMRYVGRLFDKQDGLALAFAVAALIADVVAVALRPDELSAAQFPASAGLAMLTLLLPFTLEMMALRKIAMGTFSILLSLEPAIAATFGFILLGQTLGLLQMAGIATVICVSITAVRLNRETVLGDAELIA